MPGLRPKNRYPVNFSFAGETDPNAFKPWFTVTLEINSAVFATGHGVSKKETEQDASMKAWANIKTTT